MEKNSVVYSKKEELIKALDKENKDYIKEENALRKKINEIEDQKWGNHEKEIMISKLMLDYEYEGSLFDFINFVNNLDDFGYNIVRSLLNEKEKMECELKQRELSKRAMNNRYGLAGICDTDGDIFGNGINSPTITKGTTTLS